MSSNSKSNRGRRSPAEILNSSVLAVDRDGALPLQDQIRRKIVEGIIVGSLPAGQKMPSTRALAIHLGVARNTVVAAYQQLISEGHLATRSRSGVFVSDHGQANAGEAAPQRVGGRGREAESAVWRTRMQARSSEEEGASAVLAPDWQRYPFAFMDGRLDRSLFPTAEWREANRAALTAAEIESWASDRGDADDPMLIEEVRTKVLPRRGIHARRDEILITSGTQQSLHLATQLLVNAGDTVGVEEPGHPDLRALLEAAGAKVALQAVDGQGLVVDDALSPCSVVYVSPGHQRPTGTTMPVARRRLLLSAAERDDFIIVEDDHEAETSYLDPSLPALRGDERGDRVVYAATLAQPLAPILRLGILVGPPSLIRQARRLRRLETSQPPLSLQRVAAHLLSLGHYDAIMLRVGHAFQRRMNALRDALNHYLPRSITIGPVRGGTAYWVRGPDGLDSHDLVRAAEARGVLVEPALPYYAGGGAPRNEFRMGVASIPEEKIRPGVAALAEAIRGAVASASAKSAVRAGYLSGPDLRKAMAGATLLCKTVYGDPCTIELKPNGRMSGRAGFADEETDEGRWWIEDDVWCRQWRAWAYGEIARFFTVIEGDRVQWFNAEGRLIDAAVLVRSGAASGQRAR